MSDEKWGSKRQRRAGSWELRYPTVREDGRSGPKKSETVHGTEDVAQAVLDERHKEYLARKAMIEFQNRQKLAGLAYLDDGRPDTVNDIWSGGYYPYACERVESGTMAPSTLRGYTTVYNKHIKLLFGSRPINSILHREVQHYINTLTYPQAKHFLSVIRLLWNYAASEEGGRIVSEGRNIMSERFVLPKTKRRIREQGIGIYTAEQFNRIVNEMVYDTMIEPYVILMGAGGARVSEACGVQPREIEFNWFFDSNQGHEVLWAIVPLKRTVVLNNNKTSVRESLKTSGSLRSLYIPEPYSIRLKELVSRCETTYFYEKSSGDPLDGSAIAIVWRRCFLQFSEPYIPLKNLRNTRASILLAEGYSEELVMRLLGHTSLKMLHQHYDRRTDEMLINQLMGNLQNGLTVIPAANSSSNPVNARDITEMIRYLKSIGFDVSVGSDSALEG